MFANVFVPCVPASHQCLGSPILASFLKRMGHDEMQKNTDDEIIDFERNLTGDKSNRRTVKDCL